ncbi:MAG: o-succinylbenzoate synthase [Ornithinimicrobium sp.]
MVDGARPGLDELLEVAWVLRLPLRMSFRGVTVREAMVLRGPNGWAEFAPFMEYGDHEAATWLAAAIEAGWGAVPPGVRDQVPVNATVPAISADQVPALLDRFAGCRTAKVKVAQAGQSLREDIARVSAVREALGSDAALRVDANAAWDIDQALDAITALSAYNLEYAEQPVSTVADLARLRVRLVRAGVDVPIAADESIRRAQDPIDVARAEAADLIVVKVAPLGGVDRALSIVNDCGLPAVVSSALDTSVGISAGVSLACALPTLPYACGLGTVALLERDLSPLPLVPVSGLLSRQQAQASMDSIDEPAAELLADIERRTWWQERLRRCFSLL